jgi:iron complex outermembrane receptor protein
MRQLADSNDSSGNYPHFATAGFCICTIFGAQAWAQSTNESSLVLEEVIVTAQKREEDLQRVALSVTPFTSQDIDRKGLTSLQDLDAHVPAMTVSDNSLFDKVLTIRGVGNEAARNRSTISGVALHLDGIFIASAAGSVLDFLDVERIEVLRGPQGTVYGQNATGGTVNIITRQPVIGEFSGHADLQLGTYNSINTRVYMNIPINDTLAARASLQYLNHDGYTKNLAIPGAELEDENNLTGRIQFLWRPKDNLSATFRAQLFDMDTGDRGQKNILDPTPDPRELRQDFEGQWTADSEIYSAEIKWDTSWASIKSITSYQDDATLHIRDADRSDGFYLPRTDGPYQDSNIETWTQEFNISSTEQKGLPLDWLVGFFFYDNEVNIESIEFVDRNNDGIAIRDPLGPERGFATTVDFFRDTWSLYGQGTFHLTDRWRITAGARYTEGDFKLENYGFPVLPDPRLVSESSDTKWTGRADLEWDVMEDSMVYGGWSRGYKPGGANTTLVVGNIVPLAFGETIVDAYEIGAKNRLFEDRLLLNVAAYYYDYQNLQFLNDDPIPFRGGVDSLPKSEIYGFDLEASALFADTLRLDANFSYNDTEITADKLALDVAAYQSAQQALLAQGFGLFSPEVLAVRAAAVQNVNRNSLPKAPKYIANLTLLHMHDILSSGRLTSSVSYQYRDDFQYLVFNNPSDTVSSYDIWNANFVYEPNDAPWYLEVAVYNIADSDSVQSLNTDIFAVGATSFLLIPPRQFFVRLGYDFK